MLIALLALFVTRVLKTAYVWICCRAFVIYFITVRLLQILRDFLWKNHVFHGRVSSSKFRSFGKTKLATKFILPITFNGKGVEMSNDKWNNLAPLSPCRCTTVCRHECLVVLCESSRMIGNPCSTQFTFHYVYRKRWGIWTIWIIVNDLPNTICLL